MRKLIGKIHLWLGMVSGPLVFVIAITGCIYAFQEEIKNITQPYRLVANNHKPFLQPSQLKAIADAQLPDKHLHAILYYLKDRSANAIYYSFEENYYQIVYLDPYSGTVLKVKDEYADFFRFILNGHFYLWLPPAIGQPVVASATLVFLTMLLSGLFLWWPRNQNNVRQRFTIKWNARWRRKNYDLHSVLGFYVWGIALIFAVTGLIWGFLWFRDAIYSLASGGKSYVEYYHPVSASKNFEKTTPDLLAIDLVWQKMQEYYPDAEWIEVHPPEDSLGTIAANANPDASTYWKTDYQYFDQYTLEEVSVNHIYGRFRDASVADKLLRMNYDIHVGGILGFPGKVFAFLVSLLIASLPVTGFLIWWGRRNKVNNRKVVLNE